MLPNIINKVPVNSKLRDFSEDIVKHYLLVLQDMTDQVKTGIGFRIIISEQIDKKHAGQCCPANLDRSGLNTITVNVWGMAHHGERLANLYGIDVGKFHLYVLAHELGHLKQMISGRLQLDSDANVTWEGQRYPLLEAEGAGGYNAYLQQPWEMDANMIAFMVLEKLSKPAK